ncbi:MAG: hypothetical protein ABEJ04_03175 [Halobacteriaceae archaeon]
MLDEQSDDAAGPLVRGRRWVLLYGDRRVVTAAALLTGFTLVLAASAFVVPDAGHGITERSTKVPLVSAMLSGTFFLFSIVVSVNSLFASQEQSPLGQQFGRVQDVVEFRRHLEDVVDADHVPADPERFVRLLSADILARAQRLDEELRSADVAVRENFEVYRSSLAAETGEMNGALAGADTALAVVLAMMDYNHDRQINDLRRIRVEHGDDLSGEASDLIDDLLRLLQYSATAREYFKTLYLRQEFANLSANLVYTSVPTVAVVATALHFLGRLPDVGALLIGVEAVAFAPFILVAAYVLRVAVVSRRTRAAGQFTVSDGVGDVAGIPPNGREREREREGE